MMVRLLVKAWSDKAERWYVVEDCGPYEPDNLRNGAPKDEAGWLRFGHTMTGHEGTELEVGKQHQLTVSEFGRHHMVSQVQFTPEEDGTWSRVTEG